MNKNGYFLSGSPIAIGEESKENFANIYDALRQAQGIKIIFLQSQVIHKVFLTAFITYIIIINSNKTGKR